MILWKKAWTRTSSMNQFSFTRSILLTSTWPLPFRNLNLWFLFSNVFKGQIPFPRLAWILILVMPARAGGKNTGILGTCHGTWKPKKIKSLMQNLPEKFNRATFEALVTFLCVDWVGIILPTIQQISGRSDTAFCHESCKDGTDHTASGRRRGHAKAKPSLKAKIQTGELYPMGTWMAWCFCSYLQIEVRAKSCDAFGRGTWFEVCVQNWWWTSSLFCSEVLLYLILSHQGTGFFPMTSDERIKHIKLLQDRACSA